jgi:hypothetical protein
VSSAAGTHPVIVLITVQGLLPITNRAGKLFFTKINPARLRRRLTNRSVRSISQEFFSEKFSISRNKNLHPDFFWGGN